MFIKYCKDVSSSQIKSINSMQSQSKSEAIFIVLNWLLLKFKWKRKWTENEYQENHIREKQRTFPTRHRNIMSSHRN